MKKRRTRTKTTIGSNLCIAWLLASSVAVSHLFADQKPRKERQAESYSLVAGTVFREPGFAVPGAEVVLVPAPETAQPANLKKQKSSTDARGEFAFRVPSASMKYFVQVNANGLKGQEKSVSVQGEERVDVTFMLEQESNK